MAPSLPRRPEPSGPEPRAICARCGRPARVCFCAHLVSLPTRTRVVLLQHPRERKVAIGTARMASLCLPDSTLCIGTDFARDAEVARAIADPSRPAGLLWPSAGAIDLGERPPEHPVTLVVVDGTWSQAKKLVRLNPAIAALPRWSFRPPRPSQYRIRREPADDYVSTIEALAYALGALEPGDPARFEALFEPFRAMIDAQLACEAASGGAGRRVVAKKRGPRPRLPDALASRADDVVCVYAEANAWPWSQPDAPPDELVQLVAVRPRTGEVFDAVVAPRRELAPATPIHTGLGEGELRAGLSFAEFDERWRRFAGERAVLASWGSYPRALLDAEGAHSPPDAVDVRFAASRWRRARARSMEELGAAIGVAPDPVVARGRAGLRLASLAPIVRAMIEAALRERGLSS